VPKAVRHLRRGGALGVLIDQHAGDQGVWMPFLGRLASTSPVVGLFAAGGKASAAFNSLHTNGPGRWRIRVYPVAPPGHDLSEAQLNAKIQAALEQAIREQPADWFWPHNRWKTPSPNFLLQNYRRGILDESLWSETPRPFRMLVRSPNWLGDAVMAIPAVRAFRRGRPDAHLTMLCPQNLAHLWEREPCVDAVLSFPKGSGISKVARLIRREDPFQVGILLPNSLRSALEMTRGGVWHRVGYAGHTRRALLHQVHQEQPGEVGPPEHHALRYLRLARECGAAIDEARPEELLTDPLPAPTPDDQEHAAGPKPGIVRVGICPGAEYGPTKRWFPERFAGVIRRVHERFPQVEWRLFGVADDQPAAREILDHLEARPAPEPAETVPEDTPAEQGSRTAETPREPAPEPAQPLEKCDATVINRVGETSLQQLMAELRTCRLLLTNDTGTMHLAAALGTPTVAVFGSTEPAITSPPGPGHVIIRNHVPCSPCFLRQCPFNLECMQAVTRDEVAEAVLAKLDHASRTGP
jgi:ADP-heptose:LPS heptosyltransferase